ncbi:cysteine hydrolase family protein [Glaciihabitans sp. GrIS 2.15]|uniref:cysteine hydrolase family protein n=1 Tax=Glaciihabitans sp. GrIS 2.15 TaxID=3071710 RepID=UPI002E023D80|nr:nicotinamidase-related amidase [Glaciihabitans sp. GrIS 2.15]
MTEPWLVVIDMQVVFGDPSSAWFTPGYPAIESTVAKLVEHFGERIVLTRFIAPEHPTGAWVPYYELWPFALVHHTDPLYDLMPAFAGTGHPVISRTTFGKWGDELSTIIGPDAAVVLAGVSTDCCVLSTALAAADAGVRVLVVRDACAGLSDVDHQRALDAMALYGPLIEITSADAVLSV